MERKNLNKQKVIQNPSHSDMVSNFYQDQMWARWDELATQSSVVCSGQSVCIYVCARMCECVWYMNVWLVSSICV